MKDSISAFRKGKATMSLEGRTDKKTNRMLQRGKGGKVLKLAGDDPTELNYNK